MLTPPPATCTKNLDQPREDKMKRSVKRKLEGRGQRPTTSRYAKKILSRETESEPSISPDRTPATEQTPLKLKGVARNCVIGPRYVFLTTPDGEKIYLPFSVLNKYRNLEEHPLARGDTFECEVSWNERLGKFQALRVLSHQSC